MKAEAFEQAAKEYLAAYEVVPKAGFLFNAGLAYERAGDIREASAHFRRYLELEPNGRVAPEAKARAAKLDEQIGAEDAAKVEADRQAQAADKRRLLAESHAEAARKLVEAQQYAAAIEELRAAYATDPQPLYVYRLAETHRLAGELSQAKAQYDLYRQIEPTGPFAPDAVYKGTLIEQQLQEQARPKLPAPPPAPPMPPAPQDAAEEEDEGINWWWFGIGAGLIAAGVIVDWAPESSRDGELNGEDFLPLGLYGVGGTFMAIGVF
jgi:tetratricopeptide (TPR) repeat protein